MQIDKATLLGLLIGFGGIAAGLVLEGGSLLEILQPTAALIVFGGTLGATLVAQPFSLILGAARQLMRIWSAPVHRPRESGSQIVALATFARRNGIVSLEKQADGITDPFMHRAVMLAVDGAEAHEIRRIMEIEIEQEIARSEAESRVFETAGGFSPTIGIIGAVMGLIQVMKHLEDIDEVGRGIAVAFVATIYGVGLANLLLLPAAKKIQIRAQETFTMKEMMLEGVVGLADGLNPRLIQQRLDGFLPHPAQDSRDRRPDSFPAAGRSPEVPNAAKSSAS